MCLDTPLQEGKLTAHSHGTSIFYPVLFLHHDSSQGLLCVITATTVPLHGDNGHVKPKGNSYNISGGVEPSNTQTYPGQSGW